MFRARAAIFMLVLCGVGCSLVLGDYSQRFGDARATAIATETWPPNDLVVVGGALFYTSDASIRRVDLDAGAEASTWTTESAPINALAADDTNLVWAVKGSSTSTPIKLAPINDPTKGTTPIATVSAGVTSLTLEARTVTFGVECMGCSTVMGVIDRTTNAVTISTFSQGHSVDKVIAGPSGDRLGTTMAAGVTFLLGDAGAMSCAPAGALNSATIYDDDFTDEYWFVFKTSTGSVFGRMPSTASGCPNDAKVQAIEAGTPGQGARLTHLSDNSVIYADSLAVVWHVSSDGKSATKVGTLPSTATSLAVGGGRVFAAAGNTIVALDLP